MQNGKRNHAPSSDGGNTRPVSSELSEETEPKGYDSKMVEHVRMVTSMIEGRTVSRSEVLKMLDRAKEKRQHSIGGGEKVEYRTREEQKNSS